MKVLFVYFKYHPKPPHLSNMHSNLTGSFLSIYEDDPNFTYEHVYICDEPGGIKTAAELDHVLLTMEYDVAIVSEYKEAFVSLETAKKVGKKLFIMMWDTHNGWTTNRYVNFRLFLKQPYDLGYVKRDYSLMEFAKYANVYAIDYGFGEMLPNVYCEVCPQDAKYFNVDDSVERDIDVLFNGTVYTKERMDFLQHLKNQGINVTVRGGKSESGEFLSFEDYAMCFKRAKISLSFQQSGISIQRKGRELEAAACGGFVISTNPEVWKCHSVAWFEEGKHIAKMDWDNCAERIRYFLNNTEERLNIAKALNQRYEEICSPRAWWERVFARVHDKD